MIDIMLNKDCDLDISPLGDITVVDSVRQAVMIRLKWIAGEWRLGPDFGFPWFEEVFVRNPNIPKIQSLIRSEILKVEGVTAVQITKTTFDKAKRSLLVRYELAVGEETYEEEVELYAGIWSDKAGA